MILNPWKEIERLRADLQRQTETTDMWRKSTLLERSVTENLKTALYAISALETPRCSNVVRKAARIAQEALKA